jgi:hypothetical protein
MDLNLINSWIAIILIVFSIVVLYLNKGKVHGIDYCMLFLLGVVWLSAGLFWENMAMWFLGIIFIVVGGINKNKWRQNDEMARKKKKTYIAVFSVCVVVMISFIKFLN